MRLTALLVLLTLLTGCGPKFDERHLDGLDLSGATIGEFRNKYGFEEERQPLYILGVPVYHRLRFRLKHDDAVRITSAPSGPLFIDEGSSHNAIRVWLPLPKTPRTYQDAVARWNEPKTSTIIERSQASSLPANLVGMHYSEFEINDMEVGLFYDGESDRIALITWAPRPKDAVESKDKQSDEASAEN